MRALALPVTLAFSVIACSSDKDDAVKPAEPEVKEKKKRSNVKKFESAVPYGKHVACADLIPDPAPFAAALAAAGMETPEIGEVRDKSKSNLEATSVCAFFRAGTPPSDKDQQRAYLKGGMKLGVLPGDEYCTVTASCSYPTDLDDFKKKCQAEGSREDQGLGQFACVREFQRAELYAYTFRTIDVDSQCIFEVMGGPSVTDENLVRACTKAAIDSVTPEHIKKFY